MTLDSSAVIAILFGEHGHLDLVDRILAADQVRIGTPTVVETSIVFGSRRRSDGTGEVQELLQELGVTIVPFGEREWHAATAAFLRFGRRRHAASRRSRTTPCFLSATISRARTSRPHERSPHL